MLKDKTLIYITNIYPFGNGEEFVAQEMNFLAPSFKNVIILSRNIQDPQTRDVPEGCEIRRYDVPATSGAKFAAAFNGFRPLFWKEFLKSIKHFDIPSKFSAIKTLLFAMYKGNQFRQYLENLIAEKGLNYTDVVLFNYWISDETFATSALKQAHPEITAISRSHRWDLYFERNENNFLPLRFFIQKYMDAFFFIATDGANYFRQKLKLTAQASKNLMVSRLGVLNSRASYKIELNRDELHLVSCSMIYANKRVDLIVETLAQLENVKVKWIHFGEAYDEKDMEALKAQAETELGPKENITFELAGFRTNEQVYDYYANNNVDLLINLSASEGVPVSMMECMSFGIPVLATKVGGVAEIVTNATGFLLSPDPEPGEVAEKIEHYATLSDNKKLKLREGALKMWNERYNARANYDSLIENLETIVAKNSK